MPRRPNGDTQQRILEYIEKYIDENGFPPSVREIGLAVDLKSTSTVHGHLNRLEKKGLLHREAMKPRTIVKKEEKPAMKEGHSTKRAGVRAPVRPVHVGVAAPEQKKVEALGTGPKKEVKTEEVIPMGAPKPKSDEAIPMGAPKPKADEAIPLGAPAPKSDEAIPLGSPSQETGGKEE